MFLPLEVTCILPASTEGVSLPHLELVLLRAPEAPSLLGLGLQQEEDGLSIKERMSPWQESPGLGSAGSPGCEGVRGSGRSWVNCAAVSTAVSGVAHHVSTRRGCRQVVARAGRLDSENSRQLSLTGKEMRMAGL